MNGLSSDVVSEVVELSDAVFSYDEDEFEEKYDGVLEGYLVVEDLRSRVDRAVMDSEAGFSYLDELPSFSDFGYDAESWARVFHAIEPGVAQSDLMEASDFSQAHITNVLDEMESEGLVEFKGEGRGKQYFYGENALPYLLIFSEAESLVEEYGDDVEESSMEDDPFDQGEPVSPENDSGGEKSLQEIASDVIGDEEDEGEDQEEDDTNLQDIMMDVVESEEDAETTLEQREDGGIDSRDMAGSDISGDDQPSHPGRDEYSEKGY